MSAVTLSPKFQIVIPADIRRAMGLEPGERLEVIRIGDRIELIPIRPLKTAKGFLPGLDTTVERESDRA